MSQLDTEIRRAMGELDAAAPMPRRLDRLDQVTRPSVVPTRSVVRPALAVAAALVVVAVAVAVVTSNNGHRRNLAPANPSTTTSIDPATVNEAAPGLPVLIPADLPADTVVWGVGRWRHFSGDGTAECYLLQIAAADSVPDLWHSGSSRISVAVCNRAFLPWLDPSSTLAPADGWVDAALPEPRLTRRLEGGGLVTVTLGDATTRRTVADSLHAATFADLLALDDAASDRLAQLPMVSQATFGDITVERRGDTLTDPGALCIATTSQRRCRLSWGASGVANAIAFNGRWYVAGIDPTGSSDGAAAVVPITDSIPSQLDADDPRIVPRQTTPVDGGTMWLARMPSGATALVVARPATFTPSLLRPYSIDSALVPLDLHAS